MRVDFRPAWFTVLCATLAACALGYGNMLPQLLHSTGTDSYQLTLTRLYDGEEVFSICLSPGGARTISFDLVSESLAIERGVIQYEGGLPALERALLDGFAKCSLSAPQSECTQQTGIEEVRVTIRSSTVRIAFSITGSFESVDSAIFTSPKLVEALNVVSEGRAKGYRLVNTPGSGQAIEKRINRRRP